MVRLAAVAAVALATSAYASSSGLLHRHKRQSMSDSAIQAVQGLLDIAQSVLAGNATGDCTNWVNSLQECSNLSADTAVATCACGSEVLTQLSACAPSYGDSATSSAQAFTTFCTDTLPTLDLSNSTVSSVASSVASSASSAIESLTSSAASAASSAASVVSSRASSMSSAMSSAASSASAAASASSSSASGTSGAVKTVTAGGLAGAVAVLAALAL